MTEPLFDYDLVADAIAASNAPAVVPVELVHNRDHRFVAPPKRSHGCRAMIGEKKCMKARYHPAHYGPPPSFNELGGANSNTFVWDGAKKHWQDMLIRRLDEHDLPRGKRVDGVWQGLVRIDVEGECTFPDHRTRDQGNYRVFIEKTLGDALRDGGWLEDDDWTRYEFGRMSRRDSADGECSLRLILLPTR